MKYTMIPFSAKWDELFERLYDIPFFQQLIISKDPEVMEILDEIVNLINHPKVKWIELSDEEGYTKDGIYVMSGIYESEPNLYTIIYDGQIILTIKR